MPNPIGFTDKTIGKFVKSAGGYDKVAELIRATLLESGIKNLGIIVDANDAGPTARLNAICALLQSTFSVNTLNACTLLPEGTIIREEGKPTVGIWIMPNNLNNGYLEHFLSELVDQTDALWPHTVRTVSELSGRDYCKFTQPRQQKALLHTWLAWQAEPGRPFGIALQSGYLNPRVAAAEVFLEWMRQTFLLES